MIFREAEGRDIPTLKKLFSEWISHESTIPDYLEILSHSSAGEGGADCRLLEQGTGILAAILSVPERTDSRKIVAFSTVTAWDDPRLKRFMEQQIMDWEEQRTHRVGFRVPETADRGLLGLLRSVGFFSEGLSSSLQLDKPARIHLCKHFLYQTQDEERLLDFLKDVFQRLGYETRDEENAFSFRPSPTLLLPFLFAPWHRISRIGREVILQPPVRRIELHELETVFYPLRIQGIDEKPLLLIMNARSASRLIDLQRPDFDQRSLFPQATVCRSRTIHLTDITCTHPSAARLIRKGLPLLFYVHRIGAVGWARVDDWDLDDPDSFYQKSPQSEEWDPHELVLHSASSGPMAGKLLAVRFHWFRPFKRAVSLDRMKALDKSFHPQRTRIVSPQLFSAVLEAGNAA